jgi:hypothetical protein
MKDTVFLLHVPVGTISQSDGTTPHVSCRVSAFLNGESPDRWIEIEGRHSLGLHSPDLIHLYSFFWGFVKHNFYRENVLNVTEFRDNRQSFRVRYLLNSCQYLARN